MKDEGKKKTIILGWSPYCDIFNVFLEKLKNFSIKCKILLVGDTLEDSNLTSVNIRTGNTNV